ncbi:MAG: CHC2 zinc finger domain-containing protein [Actinomycetota bacterium]|nr:CHC2 zinc finger domain-containing protein [Actinomycetota bacterium]
MSKIDWEAVRERHSLASVARRTGLDVPDNGDVTVCCVLAAHEDSTPSMFLHLDTDRYHCFGCETSGDVIQWVRDLQGGTVTEAVKVLDSGRTIDAISHDGTRSPVRITAPRPRTEQPDLSRTPPDRVHAAVEAAWAYYTYRTLHDRGVAYLAGRNIDVAALESEIGRKVIGHTPGHLAGTRQTALVDRMTAHGFSADELVDASLAARYPDGRIIDLFRQRAIVPVTDPAGRVTGLIGRYTGEHNDKAPKYLNMRRSHTYDKSVAIYRPSRPELTKHANVVVVEGVLDALAVASQAATSKLSHHYTPVCTSGLSLSTSQLRDVLAIHPAPPVIAGDGDTAGRERANLKWATAMLAAGRESVIVDWPDGIDPASWLADRGENGLVAITRKGCLEATAPQVRPQHVGRLITLAEAATIPREWDGNRTAALAQLIDGVNQHASRLTTQGSERYAYAAAPVVAPIIVDMAVDVSMDTYGNVDRLVGTVAAWGSRLPPAARQPFARHAANALESRDFGAAGWLERKLQAVIEVKTHNRAGCGTGAGCSVDYDLGPAVI